MKTFVLPALFILSATVLFAQREETVLGHRGLGLSGFWWNWSHQAAQFPGDKAYMRGSQFGLEFGKCLFIGYGTYKLQDDIVIQQDQTSTRFDMHFNAFKIGYGFMAHRAIHPVLNVDLGGAKANVDGEGSDHLFIIQPAVGVELNVFRWFRLSLEGGYRFATDSDFPSLSNQDISGLFGQAVLRFGYSWGHFGKYRREYDRDWE
ncbi:MAG: hypothetical protein SFV52_16200 [Saprospiraceae bacterium]|nr:hypothetical protein [Saprospiraceae bacterium]